MVICNTNNIGNSVYTGNTNNGVLIKVVMLIILVILM